ncbi:MAG: Yip1 family protein [Verrucomicrobiota bacterium]
MIKAFFLIFEPSLTWERIAQSRRGIPFLFFLFLLPMLFIIVAVETWGLVTFGKWQPPYQKYRGFQLSEHLHEVMIFELVVFALALATVFISAHVVKTISGTFREKCSFQQAFTLVVYSLSPMFLLRLLDALPAMNPAVTWAIGIVLTIWVLYQGVPRILMPDPTHAFGLYLSTAIVMVMTTGLARLLPGLYVLGMVDFNNSWLTQKFPELFGH